MNRFFLTNQQLGLNIITTTVYEDTHARVISNKNPIVTVSATGTAIICHIAINNENHRYISSARL
jgi:hypothetical protein